MTEIRIIQGWDKAWRPTIRNIAEALGKLESLGYRLEAGRCWIHVPSAASSAVRAASLFFTSADGEQVRVDLPMLKGCRARATLGAPRYLPLEVLDQAEVDPEGNVCLRDGTSVHAVSFDTLTFPSQWTEPTWSDLEEAIIWLTIRAFGAEHIFLRRHGAVVGIDYGILHIMREPNVHELARYINQHIGQLPRANNKPAFGFVPSATIHKTLDIAGIRKVRGRKRRNAA